MLPPAAAGFDQIGQNCHFARMAKKKTYSLYEAKTHLSAIVRPIPAAKQTL